MSGDLSLQQFRSKSGEAWLITVFGIAYLVSQVTILIVLGPIAESMLRLQVTGFSADDYVATFTAWHASGDIAFYRAHFILDDFHWIWYAGFFTALLGLLFEKLRISEAQNWLLVLPLASGLLDWFENRLQHIFLSTPDFATIIDPLPLVSTVASIFKWLFALLYIAVTVRLVYRYFRRRSAARSSQTDVAEIEVNQ